MAIGASLASINNKTITHYIDRNSNNILEFDLYKNILF